MRFGIWEFDPKFGLVGRPENLPEHYLSNARIWETEELENGEVWRWPILFAKSSWFTPKIADDFNRAFFYAQNFFEGQRPEHLLYKFDFDARTIQLQTELLSDFFLGPDAENGAEA